jgi:membrane-associated phospholipid phosphatase
MQMHVAPHHSISTQDKAIIGVSITYIVGVSIYMIAHRLWFSPDQFFVFAILGATILGRTRLFLLDWIPFLLWYFGYEYLHGLIPSFISRVHILPMIQADKFMFGFVPTIKLQSLLYTPAHLHWYDYVAVTLYICHFVTPMIVGFIFWLKDRKYFKDYTLGILVLSYAAFVTYMAFPAMPPWMASQKGYLPPVQEVTSVVMSHFLPTRFSLPTIYAFMGDNPVAAMPSLHAAFPVLIFLFVLKKSRIAGAAMALYVLGVWFAVMYLGEHYFIDVLAGTLYAAVVFALVQNKQYLAAAAKWVWERPSRASRTKASISE